MIIICWFLFISETPGWSFASYAKASLEFYGELKGVGLFTEATNVIKDVIEKFRILETKQIADLNFGAYILSNAAEKTIPSNLFAETQNQISKLSAEALEAFIFFYLLIIRDTISCGQLVEGFQIGLDLVLSVKRSVSEGSKDENLRVRGNFWLALLTEAVLAQGDFAPSSSDIKEISQRLILLGIQKEFWMKVGASIFKFDMDLIRVGGLPVQIDKLISEWEDPEKADQIVGINGDLFKHIGNFKVAQEKLKSYSSFVTVLSEINNEMRGMRVRTTEVICSLENVLITLTDPE